MINFIRKLPDAIVRLGAVVSLVVGATVVTLLLLPAKVTDHRLQVAEATALAASLTPKYAGAPACAKCHDAQREFIASGYHRNVSCETCHGPARRHATAEFPSKDKPPVPKGRGFCPTCHEYAASLPRGFPQITVVSHNPTKPCIECHDPHDPKPPHIPGECSACHNKIERAKLVSPHALLQCTTCHEAPEAHKITPRAVKPTKPAAREFCGKCHGKDTTDKDAPKTAPRIDLATHNPKYLCWECHYAHMPEVHREIK